MTKRLTRKRLVSIAMGRPDEFLVVSHGDGIYDINRGAKGKGVGVRIWQSGINRNDSPGLDCTNMTVTEAGKLLGIEG